MTAPEPIAQLIASPAGHGLAAAVERRRPTRGELRRAAILAALGELLAALPVAEIAVEQIPAKGLPAGSSLVRTERTIVALVDCWASTRHRHLR